MEQILYFFGSKFYSIKFVPFFTFFCRFPIKLLKIYYTNIVLKYKNFGGKEAFNRRGVWLQIFLWSAILPQQKVQNIYYFSFFLFLFGGRGDIAIKFSWNITEFYFPYSLGEPVLSICMCVNTVIHTHTHIYIQYNIVVLLPALCPPPLAGRGRRPRSCSGQPMTKLTRPTWSNC